MIVQPDFLDHYKTQMLVDMTSDPASPLYVLRLWAHCQQRRSARFTGLAPSALKAICRAGALEANRLRSILLQCGFFRVDGDLTIVHDWEETNAALIGSWENGKKGGRPPKNPEKTHGLSSGNPDETDKRRVEKEGEADASQKKNRARGAREEIVAYAVDRLGLPASDGEWFFERCEGNGWKNAGEAIKDWRMTLSAWKRAGYLPSQKQGAKTNDHQHQKPVTAGNRNAGTLNEGRTGQYAGHVIRSSHG